MTSREIKWQNKRTGVACDMRNKIQIKQEIIIINKIIFGQSSSSIAKVKNKVRQMESEDDESLSGLTQSPFSAYL